MKIRNINQVIEASHKKVIFTMCLFLFLSTICNSQTILISAAGDGGFETGTNFASNGWNTNTSPTTTRTNWVCGTNATSGFSGTRCAYLSNTWNTTQTHTYNLTTVARTTLYKDITIADPSETDITLSFRWICLGDGSNDKMTVWLVPTSTNLNYNAAAIIASGSAPTGNIQIGGNFSNQNSWTNYSTSIPAAYAGTTFRLVFEWVNDAVSGTTNPPAGIDDVSLISKKPICLAPNQATSFLSGTKTSTSFPASFSGSANGYLVIQSNSNIPPTQPVDGVLYSSTNISSLGSGLTFIQTSSSTSIPSNLLIENTQYFYYIYAYTNNSGCSGGPIYNASGPLIGSGITCPGTPNSLLATGITSNSFNLSWSNPNGGSASALTYIIQITTDSGYTTNISGSPFSVSANTINITSLSASTTYYYRILASNGCNSSYVNGNIITLAPATPCSNATNLACGTINLAGTTVGSTNYSNGSGCFLSDFGKWYTFIGDGNLNTITTTGTGGFDQEMAIARGSCGSLTNITCQDVGFSNGNESYSFVATLGTTYYVYVAHYLSGSSTTGTFTISRTCTTPIANDECTGVTTITANSGEACTTSVSSTTVGATQSQSGCAGTADDDVWFKFVAISTSHIMTVIPGTLNDAVLQFFSGNCGSLTSFGCLDSTSGSSAEIASLTGLTIGNTYYMRVYSYSNGSGQGTFTACLTTPIPPCSNITPIACGTNSVTISPGNGIYSPGSCGWSTPGREVIFSFTPTVSGNYTISQSNAYTYIDYFYKIASGGCSGTGWTCIFDTSGAATSATFNLTAGIQYYFLLDPENTNGGTVNFSLNCPCNPGTGTGVTTLGCPYIVTGGLGLNGADSSPINCNSGNCVNLEATYLQLNQTTNYTVSSIPYSPPYQFGCLTNQVSVNIDDRWSSIVNLPFNFCFYGNSYNSCVIGSNGMLSFNTSYATTSSGYEFNNNLPSTVGALFGNTIYGVYHDIDPSKGGEVGWELITLNTGCRALIASWKDVPMYRDNTIKYTGMMVLYENTNIIEVYIKEKLVDSYSSYYNDSWNWGNAIVGVQNAAGTSAVVAPGRNGLDTNWSTINEAWRFTPSGSSLTSIKWFEGLGTTGPLLGTTNTINVCPTFTTTYTAEVTYTLCNGTNLKIVDDTTVNVNGSKVWNGSIDTDWDKNNNWTPIGIPNGTDCVTIPNTTNKPIVSGSSYNGLAGTLTVLNNALLTINSNNSITVTDWVNIQPTGGFLINNNASLVQINNTTNIGNIVYKRNAFIRSLDYVYWSSPVSNFNINNIASPLSFWGIYKWNTIVANPNGGQGNWENASGNIMIPGKGYIASGPSSFSSSTASNFNGSFTGVPNNGNITLQIQRGNDTNTSFHVGNNGSEISNYSDNWNLVGNPYPSAIRGSQFLFNNNTKIEGNIKLWTHGTLPANIASPFYDSFAYNYSPGDYLTYNFTGTSCCPLAASDLFIGSGQGFFVQMIDGPAATDFISFNNDLRSSTYSNSTFYRTLNEPNNNFDINSLERNRIWLDIINSNGQSDRTLFGYIEGATMNRDSFYDCVTQNTGGTLIYSLIDNTKYSIQGRSLPFDINDEVPIGVNIPSSGNYSIAIGAVDGLFNYQNIYLKDILLNITHDIKTSPYQFTSQSGIINDRFKIVYQQNSLGINDLSINNNIKVITNDEVAVSSSNLQMDSIIVFNVLGQKINTYNNINNNYFTLNNLRKNNTTLLLKIKLNTGEIIIRKVLY
ncbi:fibronectin type III domain-containing protein [Flavobacterium capsici]|uniref:Fibronectin type III domain-containing protein n=1 Tax=Flavobacterium capsici TaxID=3075618 RepID=A0AA96F0S0_9FLAO|nr:MULTISPECIES: fibronectin type III domain-containing protein [unclassified Flavobacterium]WNM19081.1 fibronectin type III domain-containing protein [Flavobacterium sp. PMR2A8]WNM20470.1 fibronectin type III domain-containing protein [Flavobacterium sp. PMTSA4]